MTNFHGHGNCDEFGEEEDDAWRPCRNKMDCAVTTNPEEFLGQVEENADDCLSILAESADRVFGDAKQCLDDFTREEQARLQRERG